MRRTATVIAALCFVFAAGVSAPALAAPSPASAETYANDEGGQVVAQGADRRINYGDEEIEGELPRPSGERISARHSPKHPSLIQLRVRFNDHLIRLSADI